MKTTRPLILSIVYIAALAAQPSFAQPSFASPQEEANNLITYVNALRAKLNIPALQQDPNLNQAAQIQSNNMASAGKLTSHYGNTPADYTLTDRLHLAQKDDWTKAAENVACGYNNAVDAFRALANSPGHLKNMINPNYTYTGAALVLAPNTECKSYWAQVFYNNTFSEELPTPQLNPVQLKQILSEITKN